MDLVCVYGIARWEVFAISVHIKLKSLNICLEF